MDKKPSNAAHARLLRSAASALKHGRYSTANKKLRQADEMLATLKHPATDAHRAGCMACQMAHDKSLPDHGSACGDATCSHIQCATYRRDTKRAARRAGVPAPVALSLGGLRDADDDLAILDAAVNAAEDHLRRFLPRESIDGIVRDFLAHAQCHLADELANIKAHGHRNDDPDDEPDAKQYLIHYAHLDCKVNPAIEWEDTWSCAVNGVCPACGTKDIEPVDWEEVCAS